MTDKDELKLALEKIIKANAKVRAICSGEERWTMSIPARPDHDSDLVIASALGAAMKLIKEALAQPEQEPTAKYSDIVSDGGLDPRNKFDAQPQRTEQEPVTSSLVECVMSARKEFSAIKGESQFCTECHAFERADSWWQEWHGGDIDYITGAVYTTPPQRKPLLASEIVTMYAECPTSDNDMIAFARAIEAAHGIKENT
jgi:hypothetical protein